MSKPAVIILIMMLSLPLHLYGQTWKKVWTEDFEGEVLNTDHWSYQYGTGESEGLTGWGNYELQYYTDREENIFVEDGKLHIIAKVEQYEGMDFTSARIRSKEKKDFKYGRFEIRAKLPEGQGIWPAIWMMPTESVYGPWPGSGEIDIMELVGHEPDVVHGTVHYGTNQPYDHQFTGGSYTLEEGKFSDDFHVFTIEWSPERIRWFVDDEFFFMVTPNQISPYRWPFDEYFHFILNVAVGGTWPGHPDGSTEFPQSMIVDYIHVYEDEELVSSEDEPVLPESAQLHQNYPNPFNPATQIRFELPGQEHAILEVYNMLGQKVAVLVDEPLQAGMHIVDFDGRDLSSGTYIYSLRTESGTITRQMSLVK